MQSITFLFLTLLIASTILQLWLTWRNIRHVRAHRGTVPEAFRDRITLTDHQKAADYTLAGNRLGVLETIYAAVLLWAWTLGGGLDWLDQTWRGAGLGPILTGIAMLASAMLIMGTLDLPFSLYHTFSIEQKFGFNKTTLKTFVTDLLKQTLISAIIGLPLLWIVLWLMQVSGPNWWLYVWIVWMSFTFLMMWAWPKFIAPLFNKFTPLEDTALKTRIDRLLQRCGFRSNGVFVMDGSRRSGHGNAYFTGVGNNKRIVFFDTLLESLSPEEVEAVLAHELGHFRLKHIQKRIISVAAIAFVSLWILGWLIDKPWFYEGLGVSNASTYIGLLLFMMVSPLVSSFLSPVFSALSRKHEFEADGYAAENAEASDLIHALVKMYKENASTLTPDPLYSAFHDSHPPAPVRITHLSARMDARPVET